ncbi:MAG: DUF2029 domain-containing protein [Candidatus Omnitrophica bacterium]|nr:DUF2029 domain-containing protein [Candidatus Omnitrophota bacterium]
MLTNLFRYRDKALMIIAGFLAIVSIGKGYRNALMPGQSQDLLLVYNWTKIWLWNGVNPYDASYANYLPHGLLILSPLTLFSEEWISPIWGVLNLIIAPLIGYLAFRMICPQEPIRKAITFTLMVCTWAGIRVGIGNGQFSLWAFGLGLLAVAISDKKPYLSGILLALSLTKPHIGCAFVLWALFVCKFKILIISVCIMIAGWSLFSLRVLQTPLEVAHSFFVVLEDQFFVSDFFRGNFELRPLIYVFLSDSISAGIVHNIIVVSSLIVIGTIIIRERDKQKLNKSFFILNLCCVWCLMSFFHNVYDIVLMIPFMADLYGTMISPNRSVILGSLPRAVFWGFQFSFVAHLPGIVWKLTQQTHQIVNLSMIHPLLHFDRLFPLLALAYLLYLFWGRNHIFLKHV